MNYNNIYYMKKNIFILLAAGIGERFDKKVAKQFIKIGNFNPIELIINEIILNKNIDLIIIVYNKNHKKRLKKILSRYKKNNIRIVEGGKYRQESSYKALQKLKSIKPINVIIHDACRPNIRNKQINKIINLLKKYDGCAPVIKNVDLARIKKNNKMIEYKSTIFLTQTPQGFKYKNIFSAHKRFKFQNSKDDIEIINNDKNKIKFIEGYKDNIKITYKRDIDFFMKKNNKNIKYGIGYDIHKFNFLSKKKLKLCGVKIKYFPLESYSDGDVGYHAVCDSIFGALGIGDIGKIFKNTDIKWKNANSKIFLQYALNKINQFNAKIINIDINFICEKPNISHYSKKMRQNIAKILKINISQINIKATTNEKISFIGEGKAIAAESITSICI